MKVSGSELRKLVSLKQSEQLLLEEEPDKKIISPFFPFLFFLSFFEPSSKKPRVFLTHVTHTAVKNAIVLSFSQQD